MSSCAKSCFILSHYTLSCCVVLCDALLCYTVATSTTIIYCEQESARRQRLLHHLHGHAEDADGPAGGPRRGGEGLRQRSGGALLAPRTAQVSGIPLLSLTTYLSYMSYVVSLITHIKEYLFVLPSPCSFSSHTSIYHSSFIIRLFVIAIISSLSFNFITPSVCVWLRSTFASFFCAFPHT